MAGVSPFGYGSGSSVLHRIDVRFKLLFMVLISLSCLRASAWGLALLTVLFAFLLADSPLRLSALGRSLRWALFLLGLVFAARALSEPGQPVFAVGGLGVTRQGLHAGLLVGWRLLLILLSGVLLSTTTRASEIRSGVQWLLDPIPRVPAGRVATMMGLVLRFVPLLIQQAAEINAAQRSRGIENRKNPAYRLRMASLPLLRKSFERADRLALAMEARGYSERGGAAQRPSSRVDRVALGLVGCICLGAVLL